MNGPRETYDSPLTAPLLMAAGTLLLAAGASGVPGQAGDDGVQVARWKDNKKAAFLLMFDDNMPSHLKNAIPELRKRGFTGTFYVCPGKAPFWTAAWQKEIPGTGMEYGNHTNTHSGAKDAAQLEEELKACNEAIARAFPDRATPRLISFGKPGTPKGTWTVSDAQLKESLARFNLIDRGPFLGAAIHYKTGKDMIAAVDKAIAGGKAGTIIFHGVGGEWISAPLPDYIELLDYLASRKEDVWVTDHISSHKYDTERGSAEVKVMARDDRHLQLALSSKADPKLYDQPLTLLARVPASWKGCEITQGTRKTAAKAAGGTLQFEAVPGAEAIHVRAAE